MDSMEIYSLVKQSPTLKTRFLGCASANNIRTLQPGTFQIVNTADHGDFGEHWLLICWEDELTNSVIFYDSFGNDLKSRFSKIYLKLYSTYKDIGIGIKQFVPSRALTQSDKTTLCGLYCIFVAHYVFTNKLDFPNYATEEDVLRFACDNFGAATPRNTTFIH